jgi:hypothetical protein
MDLLTVLGAALAAAHFGTPLAYYAARRWLKTPWRIKPDPPMPLLLRLFTSTND